MNKWFLLPGMGATAAMYNALRHKIDFENGDIIGGSSLGGLVALEIGQVIQPKACVLLGSAVNISEVQSLLAMFSPLVTITPIALVQVLAGKQKNLVSAMFANANAEFIRAMCSYLHLWPGYIGQMSTIYRMHGRKDEVIPCPSAGATVIEDAGHLLAM